jgi:acetyl esterase/lipase
MNAPSPRAWHRAVPRRARTERALYLTIVRDLHGGLPPTILTAGTRDFLLSDTVRLHRKLLRAGVRAELHVWEGAPHGVFRPT